MAVEVSWRGCPLLWLEPLVGCEVLLDDAPGTLLVWLNDVVLGAAPLTA
jgi:hypothetical protein